MGRHEETNMGQKIRMYHGTTAKNARSISQHGFRPSSSGMLGAGVYLSHDQGKATQYGDGTILECEVDVGRVKGISTRQDRNDSWRAQGYDCAWVRPGVQTSGEETCMRDPSRICVITNPAASAAASAKNSDGEAVWRENGIYVCKLQKCQPKLGRQCYYCCKYQGNPMNSDGEPMWKENGIYTCKLEKCQPKLGRQCYYCCKHQGNPMNSDGEPMCPTKTK